MPETITARYLTRFRCIGPACEDNCCHGWLVQIDRRRYRALENAMSATPAAREELAAKVALDESAARGEARHALIKLDPVTKNCLFLDGQSLCTVHARYGEDTLPYVCDTYPRIFMRNGHRREIWGMSSCPELLRQSLLHEDALDLVEAPPELASRDVATLSLDGRLTPYREYLDDVRGAAFRVLSMRVYPMRTRLFLLAYLGQRTARFFHKSIGSLDETRLATAIDDVTRPETVERWHRELADMQAPEVLAAQLVTQMINERLRSPVGPIRSLVRSIVDGYGDAAAPTVDEQGRAVVPVERLWAAFTARRQAWAEALPARIDLYFENYAKNFWMSEWYVSSDDLLAHTLRLLVRVALLRFLLFGHPSLEAARALPLEARSEALDRAAVEVFYKFSRDIEHDLVFLAALESSLAEHGFQTFSHAAFLALV